MPSSATCHPDRPSVSRGKCHSCYTRDSWRAAHPGFKAYGRVRKPHVDSSRENKHGVTRTAFDEMLEAQAGLCAICARPFTATPDIDHDHVTGAIRGLLCRKCNLALGLVDDDPTRLRAAAAYLEREPNA